VSTRPLDSVALMRVLAFVLVLGLCGCSQVRLAYSSADLLLTAYAESYLDLKGPQIERWEPQLQRVLTRHRREELPYLAAFFGRALQAGRAGFTPTDTACLLESARELYRRHARLAVTLAAPLLADLDSTQIHRLKSRFARDLAEDQSRLGDKKGELDQRARRYAKAIEEWTGPLGPDQQALVAEVTGRMPDTSEALIAYRTRKRGELVALLESGAGFDRIGDFLTSWLVDYRDLPPELEQAGALLEDRLVELVSRLGATLTGEQHRRLEKRLSGLRRDLLKLQTEPRLAHLGC